MREEARKHVAPDASSGASREATSGPCRNLIGTSVRVEKLFNPTHASKSALAEMSSEGFVPKDVP